MLNRKLLCFDLVVISWRERFINPHECTAHRYTALSKKKSPNFKGGSLRWQKAVNASCSSSWGYLNTHARVSMLRWTQTREGATQPVFLFAYVRGRERQRERWQKLMCAHAKADTHVCASTCVCICGYKHFGDIYLRRGVCPVTARGFNTLHWPQLYGRCCQSRVYSKRINKTDLPTLMSSHSSHPISTADVQWCPRPALS